MESAVWNAWAASFFLDEFSFTEGIKSSLRWVQDPCCTYITTKPQPLQRRGISTNFGAIQTAPSACRALSRDGAVSILSRIVRCLDSFRTVNASVCG